MKKLADLSMFESLSNCGFGFSDVSIFNKRRKVDEHEVVYRVYTDDEDDTRTIEAIIDKLDRVVICQDVDRDEAMEILRKLLHRD